jgi:hypothetical protein
MGLRSEHESDDTRRGDWRTNGRAAAACGLLHILTNSWQAPRRTARRGLAVWGGESRGAPAMERLTIGAEGRGLPVGFSMEENGGVLDRASWAQGTARGRPWRG